MNVNSKNRFFFYISVTPTKLSPLPDTTAQVSNNVDHGIFGYGKISDLTDGNVETAINFGSGQNRWVRFIFPKVYEVEFMIISGYNQLARCTLKLATQQQLVTTYFVTLKVLSIIL